MKKIQTIFTKNSDSIESLKISEIRDSIDKLNIIIESKKAEEIQGAITELVAYINNLSLVKQCVENGRATIAKELKNMSGVIDEYYAFAGMYDKRIKKGDMAIISFVPAEIKQKALNLEREKYALESAMKNLIGVELVAKPYISKTPVKPNTKRNIFLAGTLSLFAGVFLAFLLEYKDIKIKQ